MREHNKENNSINQKSKGKLSNPLIKEDYYKEIKVVYKKLTFHEKELVRLMYFEKFEAPEISKLFQVSTFVLEDKIKHIQQHLENAFKNKPLQNEWNIEYMISSYFFDLMHKDDPIKFRDINQDVKNIKRLASLPDCKINDKIEFVIEYNFWRLSN